MPFYQGEPRFFYRRWRSQAPRAKLLLLHGFGENSGYFHRFAAELTRADIDVWAPDHVGHGLSGEHDGLFESVDQLAVNAAALLDEITAIRPDLPLFLLGHSLGGLTAVKVAAEHSARLSGLILSGPPVVGRPAVLPEKMIFSLDESYVDDARNDPLGLTSPDAEACLWRAVADFVPRMAPLLGRLDLPTLVVFGEHDVFTTPDEARIWTAGLSDAQLWVVPGGYHDILQDTMHRAVAAGIIGFIADHAVAGRPSARDAVAG